MVKLADAPDSKSGGLNARVGSIPSSGTISIYCKLKGNVRENDVAICLRGRELSRRRGELFTGILEHRLIGNRVTT